MCITLSCVGRVGGGGYYLSVCKSAPTKYKPLYLILISPLTPVLDVRLKTRSCAGKGQFIRSYTSLANTLQLLSLLLEVLAVSCKPFVYGANIAIIEIQQNNIKSVFEKCKNWNRGYNLCRMCTRLTQPKMTSLKNPLKIDVEYKKIIFIRKYIFLQLISKYKAGQPQCFTIF